MQFRKNFGKSGVLPFIALYYPTYLSHTTRFLQNSFVCNESDVVLLRYSKKNFDQITSVDLVFLDFLKGIW